MVVRPGLVKSIPGNDSDVLSEIGRVDLRSQMSYELCDKVARNDSSGGETDSPDASASSAQTENDENETTQADEFVNDDGKTGTSDAIIDKEDGGASPDASDSSGSSAETDKRESVISPADEVVDNDDETGTSDAIIDKEDDVTSPDASDSSSFSAEADKREGTFTRGKHLQMILKSWKERTINFAEARLVRQLSSLVLGRGGTGTKLNLVKLQKTPVPVRPFQQLFSKLQRRTSLRLT